MTTELTCGMFPFIQSPCLSLFTPQLLISCSLHVSILWIRYLRPWQVQGERRQTGTPTSAKPVWPAGRESTSCRLEWGLGLGWGLIRELGRRRTLGRWSSVDRDTRELGHVGWIGEGAKLRKPLISYFIKLHGLIMLLRNALLTGPSSLLNPQDGYSISVSQVTFLLLL